MRFCVKFLYFCAFSIMCLTFGSGTNENNLIYFGNFALNHLEELQVSVEITS